MTRIRTALALVVSLLVASAVSAQNLEIHYINVGWGSSVLVKGPDGTTVLLEAGNTGDGTNEVVPYLKSIGIQPADGLDYMIGGHQHCDHIGGLDEVINAGYDVRERHYSNGSSYTSSCVDGWENAAATTTAGRPVAIRTGTTIPLGNGAVMTCVAVNGKIIGGGTVSVSDENDRSIALLIQYGGFDYLWASDLGGGSIDNSCTGRSTQQTDVETAIVEAISPGGAHPLIPWGGIDVLNVNHHGSESSTNNNWMDYSVPAVAVVPTGAGQTTGWDLPRIDVVENVLLAQADACVDAPPTLVLQTEEGSPAGNLTSTAGYCVGNIRIVTDGVQLFTVSADGAVNQGPNEVAAASLPRSFTIDGDGGSEPPPPPPPPGTSIAGWSLVQASSANTFVFPSGTVVPDHGYVVIARNATKAEFEAFWNVTLPADAVFIDANDAMPVINGDETFTLKDASGRTVDGRTVAMSASAARSYQRINPCGSASKSASWTVVSDTAANPGSGAVAGCAKGVIINEFSDASGTGNFIYEFVELHNDR